MPQPQRSDIHIDAPLTDLSIAYLQSQANFIATQAAPILPVDKQTNKYFKFDKDAWFRDEAKKRKSGEETAGSGFTVSNDNYSCDLFGFHKDLDDFDLGNQDAPLDLDQTAAEFVTRVLLLRQEIQWVTDCFNTGIWGTDVTPANTWDNFAASDPRDDIDLGKETVLKNTGFEPNVFILGYQTFRKLRRHPDVVDMFKYTSAESITTDMLARFFDIDKILVAKAVKNTAKEGQAFTGAFTHGKNALLAYIAPNPGLLEPSAMYTFAWTGQDAGMSLKQISLRRFRMEQLSSERIEGFSAFDNKIVGSDLGYFFNAAVA
jgi:hypothetical protein